MLFRSGLLGLSLLLIPRAALPVQAQAAPPISSHGSSLQQLYEAAQRLQGAGKLNEAAAQYREFVADALAELARGYALVPDYPRASALFNDAIALQPASSSLLLDYARTALVSGDIQRAKTLATSLIQQSSTDRQKMAEAHQILGRALLKLNLDQQARKELEAAVALDPTFANGYDLAVACLDLDDDKCAVQIFSEMQAAFGDTAQIHLAFARAYGDSDFQPRAITEVRRSIEENPRLPGAHYLLAALLLATTNDQNPLETAEAELKKELEISPRDATTYAALGKIALTRKDYADAENYLGKATSLAPGTPDAYLYLGQLYFETNRIDRAEEALRNCVRLTKDISRNRYQVQKAHYLLGRILMKQGKQEAAHVEMNTARDLADRTLSQDKNKLASLMDSAGSQDAQTADHELDVSETRTSGSQDPKAASRVEDMRERFTPVLADSYNNLGAIAATNSHYAEAVTYFKEAAVWKPSLEGLDYNWGRAAFAGSLFANAVAPLSRYAKAHPNDQGASSALGFSQFMTGDYRGCIETLQPMVGTTDFAPQIEYAYADSLVKTGRVVEGIAHLTALEKAHPEIGDVHRSLGEALDRQGQRERATEEMRTAVQLGPQDGAARYDLGKMELGAGNTPAAIIDLEAAVHLVPDSAPFHEMLARAYASAMRPADAQKEMATYNSLRSAAK